MAIDKFGKIGRWSDGHIALMLGSHDVVPTCVWTLSLNFLVIAAGYYKVALHLAYGMTERALLKLEWRIVDLAKLVGQGLQRSKTSCGHLLRQ